MLLLYPKTSSSPKTKPRRKPITKVTSMAIKDDLSGIIFGCGEGWEINHVAHELLEPIQIQGDGSGKSPLKI